MIGWVVAWKCFVACLFFDESQQPTADHTKAKMYPVISDFKAFFTTSRTWLDAPNLVEV